MDRTEHEAISERISYDLKAALDHNGAGLDAVNCKRIVLEITGENDGKDWHWIVELNDGRFAYVSGGCDYTGWGCRSSAEAHVAASLAGALMECNEPCRAVFQEMIAAGETKRTNNFDW